MSAWHDGVVDLTLFEALTGGAFDRENGNIGGNLTLNEARPVGHLTFVPKRLSGFRTSLIQQVSRVHGSLVLSIPQGFFCCCHDFI